MTAYGFKRKLHTACAAALLALGISLSLAVWGGAQSAALSGELVRLHVLADSDEPYEQELKLRVRDAVLSCTEDILAEVETASAARGALEAALGEIEAAALSASEGRAVAVALSEESYPTRSYGLFALPAGRYCSLRVVIGSGEGHNWWCVVFPPLCTAAVTEPEELPQAVASVSGVALGEPKYALRFRSMELWGELRGLFK